MEFLSNKPLLITDTILRDAHQSQAATRMTLEDMLPACEVLDSIGMYHLRNETVDNLAYGRQKVCELGRALMTTPQLILLDEPAAGLDPLGKREIMQLLHKIHKEWCKTVIIVSHDMDEISENCTRAAVFSEGKVFEEASPSRLFLRPAELTALGLDVPFTAKVTEALAAKGINIYSDFTSADFVGKVLSYAGLEGGGAHA